MAYQFIKTEESDGIFIVTLNRPNKKMPLTAKCGRNFPTHLTTWKKTIRCG